MGFPRQEYWSGWSFPSPIFGDRAVLTGEERTVSATISAWMLSFPHDAIFSIRTILGACNRTGSWLLPQLVTESLVMKPRDTFCSQTAQMILCTRELESPYKDNAGQVRARCAMVPPLRRDWHSGEPGKGVGRGWPLSWVLGMIIDLFTGKGRESISGKGKLLIMSQRWEWAQRMAEIGGQLWGAICNFKLINLYRSPQCSDQCMQGG